MPNNTSKTIVTEAAELHKTGAVLRTSFAQENAQEQVGQKELKYMMKSLETYEDKSATETDRDQSFIPGR